MNLIETAGELGCVELQKLASPPPPTLFSPPAPVVLQKASDLDDDKEVGSKIFFFEFTNFPQLYGGGFTPPL